jgi:drug/metabolite transporter (DMT)-like permease
VSPTLSYALCVVTSLLAGAAIAASGVLQQRAASRRPREEQLSPRLVVHLFSDRGWLAGLGLAGLSYGFQAVALTLGPLALVQPLVVSELLFAIPVSLRLHHLRLRGRDWAFAAAVVVGLAVGFVAAAPRTGRPVQPFSTWLPALVVVAVLAGGAVLASRRLRGPAAASALGFAGALVMALQSALYSATLHTLGERGWATFAGWEPYTLVVVSVLGGFLVQNAFHTGPLAAASPVIEATLPVAAIAFGIWLFGEHVRTSPLGLAGAVVGLVLVLGGIVGLDTSPVVRREQRLEKREQEKSEQEETAEQETAGRGPADRCAG